ncbi:MAG: PolC-type DNA polymerase III [Bdellovibrionales bacterium]
MKFIAFDLETTGTLPGVDRIVEVGAVRFVDGEVEAIFSTLVDPGMAMPAAASAVNGIKDDMLIGKPKIEEVLRPLTEFCENSVLVAHNAAFDTQFLTADYRKYEVSTPGGVILDTYPMAKKIFPGLANYKLSTLVQHLAIESQGFHRAEEDATYCAKLLLKMVERITGAVNRWPPLENLVTLTGKPESRFPVIEPEPKQLSLL